VKLKSSIKFWAQTASGWSRQHHMLGLLRRNRHSNRVSASCGLRFRETGFRSQRKMRRNHLPTVTMPSLRTNRRTDPANSGLFVLFQEISGSIRLRGGPGRTRTSNQTVIKNSLLRELGEIQIRDRSTTSIHIPRAHSLAKHGALIYLFFSAHIWLPRGNQNMRDGRHPAK
jgi:hypothetical protein